MITMQDVIGMSEEMPSGCWNWKGPTYLNKRGVTLQVPGGKSALRTVWTIFYGMPEQSERIMHKCPNNLCVRPSHLRKVAKSEVPGWEPWRGVKHYGAENGKTKLSDEEVLMIRAWEGTNGSLARKLDVSEECVRKIRNGTRRQTV
jgi:hypothetical protein